MSAIKEAIDDLETHRQQAIAELVDESGDDWADDVQPGSFSCHELLDRTALIADLIERQLREHPACLANPEWYALVEQAAASLHELYQRVGAAHLSVEQ